MTFGANAMSGASGKLATMWSEKVVMSGAISIVWLPSRRTDPSISNDDCAVESSLSRIAKAPARPSSQFSAAWAKPRKSTNST